MISDPRRAAPRVWITRAQPGAAATAARVHARGFTPVTAPVLEVWPMMDAVIDLAGVDALAFTSAAGVSAFAALTQVRDRKVFTVGDATAGAARAAGFAEVRSAKGDAQALSRLIADASPRPVLVLNPTAAEPAADLAALLAAHGLAARSVVVYETRETALAASPPDLEAVLVQSAKAARAVARLTEGADVSAVTVCVLSAAAAAPLAGVGFRRILVADKPAETALLSLLGG
jgi:uroporphyrinogen-III synthase